VGRGWGLQGELQSQQGVEWGGKKSRGIRGKGGKSGGAAWGGAGLRGRSLSKVFEG
jgi:hypothetical protein